MERQHARGTQTGSCFPILFHVIVCIVKLLQWKIMKMGCTRTRKIYLVYMYILVCNYIYIYVHVHVYVYTTCMYESEQEKQ